MIFGVKYYVTNFTILTTVRYTISTLIMDQIILPLFVSVSSSEKLLSSGHNIPIKFLWADKLIENTRCAWETVSAQ